MTLHTISSPQLYVRIHDLFDNQWLILTCGDFEKGDFNGMTISWGSLGVMWSKAFAQVVVRPTRYTHTFMEKYPTFTLCAFPEEYRSALNTMGSRSGRNCDKIAEAGLTPIPSSIVSAPCYAEAELVIECRKMFFDDFKPAHFVDPSINRNYPQKDYHRIYFGEILAIRGIEKYLSRE